MAGTRLSAVGTPALTIQIEWQFDFIEVQQLVVGPVSAASEYNISADQAAKSQDTLWVYWVDFLSSWLSGFLWIFIFLFLLIDACGTYSCYAVGQLVRL